MRNSCFFGLADQTTGLNGKDFASLNRCSQSAIVFLYRPQLSAEKKENSDEEKFFELLKLTDVSELKKYLKLHRLSPAQEYQLVVTLGMEMEDEALAERIICNYVRRFGLSLKAKQVLVDLHLDKALRALKSYEKQKADLSDLCEEDVSPAQKLQDGFNLLYNGDVADRGFYSVFWGEPLYA